MGYDAYEKEKKKLHLLLIYPDFIEGSNIKNNGGFIVKA